MKTYDLPYWKGIRQRNLENRARKVIAELDPIDLFFSCCLGLFMVRRRNLVRTKLYEIPMIFIGAFEYWRFKNTRSQK